MRFLVYILFFLSTVCQGQHQSIFFNAGSDDGSATEFTGIHAQDHIIYDGNSFWAAPYNVPQYITTGVGGEGVRFATVNLGVGAQSIGWHDAANTNYLLHNIGSRLPGYRDITRLRDVVVVFEGINDLYFQCLKESSNQSDSTYNNYLSYLDYVTGLGYQVVINTLTPRDNVGTPSTYEAQRQIVNSRLRTLFSVSTGVTRITRSSYYPTVILVDVGNDPNYGQAGQPSNTTWYQTDLVHPTAAMGQNMATNYYVPAINMF